MDIYAKTMSKGDPRTEEWLLVSSPIPMMVTVVMYVYFAIKGPKMVENIKPLKLKYVLIPYNFFLVGLSMYMFKELLITSYQSNYKYNCQRVDYTNNALSLRMANVIWWFYITKFIELFETVFFVLRKKQQQITVLHVYHHCSMLIIWWSATKYVAGGQSFFPAMINSFVHIFMYTYYALSVFGDSMKPYLWWKRYLTQMQVAQFLAIIVHVVVGLKNNCHFPAFMMYFGIFYCTSLTVLFLNYYVRTYVKKNRQLSTSKKFI